MKLHFEFQLWHLAIFLTWVEPSSAQNDTSQARAGKFGMTFYFISIQLNQGLVGRLLKSRFEG